MRMRSILMISCSFILVVIAFALFLRLGGASKEPVAVTPPVVQENPVVAFDITNGNGVAKETIVLTPPDDEDLGNSVYLVDADFVLSEGNLNRCLRDFFAAPCALDFYLEDAEGNMIYRCEDPVLSAKFARATEAAAFYVISMRKYEAAVAGGSVENPYHEATYERAYFANAIGQVSLVIGKDGTYLDFYRKHEGSAEKTESGRTFFSFSNIYPALLEVKAEIASQCVVMD